MEILTIAIKDINPAEYNPRKDLRPGDPEYDKLKKSILEFDIVEPLVWNKQTGNLVGGHQRLKVLQELGIENVEVSAVDLSPVKEKALNIALNKIQGEWDFPKLKDLLEELDTGEFDMEITGYGEKEIEDLMTQFHIPGVGKTPDDAIPEQPERICKKGDLWQLGTHRLLCGDATKQKDAGRLMGGEMAQMVMADPPYNVQYTGGSGNRSKRKDSYTDNMSPGDYEEWLRKWLRVAGEVSDNKAALHLWFAASMMREIVVALDDTRWQRRALIIWNKLSAHYGALGSQYKYHHEPCYYAHKKGKSPRWFGPTNEPSVWDCEQPRVNDLHPTMKPVSLYERSVRNHTQLNNLILECFGGSGTTIIVCEKLGRRCYMMEIDAQYCDVIIARWQDYTGQKAEKLNVK